MVGVFLLFPSLAHAHTAGASFNGWQDGFNHPLHGWDHLLAMLAVGIWAAQQRGRAVWLIPLTFLGVMSVGGIVGATGMNLPGVELAMRLHILWGCERTASGSVAPVVAIARLATDSLYWPKRVVVLLALLVLLCWLGWWLTPHVREMARRWSNNSPEARLRLDAAVESNRTATVSDAGSVDKDGQIRQWIIDWGDGKRSSFESAPTNISHSYAKDGTNRITLICVDDVGATNANDASETVRFAKIQHEDEVAAARRAEEDRAAKERRDAEDREAEKRRRDAEETARARRQKDQEEASAKLAALTDALNKQQEDKLKERQRELPDLAKAPVSPQPDFRPPFPENPRADTPRPGSAKPVSPTNQPAPNPSVDDNLTPHTPTDALPARTEDKKGGERLLDLLKGSANLLKASKSESGPIGPPPPVNVHPSPDGADATTQGLEIQARVSEVLSSREVRVKLTLANREPGLSVEKVEKWQIDGKPLEGAVLVETVLGLGAHHVDVDAIGPRGQPVGVSAEVTVQVREGLTGNIRVKRIK